jgi:phage-related protein
MHALGPAFHDLRLDVQQQLFTGVGAAIADLSQRWLPTLHVGLSGIAQNMRLMVIQGLAVASSQQSIADGGIAFSNINDALEQMKPILGYVVAIWRDFATVGSEFLPGLAIGLTNVTKRLADWVAQARASGELNTIIQTALTMIGNLVKLIESVGRVFMAAFGPAIQAGSTLIQIFTTMFNTIADVLNRDFNQNGLKTFFDGIATAVQALQPALIAVVDVLSGVVLPALGQMFAALAPLVNTLLVQFADLFRQLAPIIPSVTGAIVALLNAVSPLIPVFSEIITAILPVVAQLVTELAPIIGSLAQALGDALLAALEAIQPILPVLAQAFVDIVKAVAPMLPALLELATSLIPPLVQVLQILIPPLVQIAQTLFPALVKMINALSPLFPVLADLFIKLVEAVLPILPALTQLVVYLLPPLTDLIKLMMPVLVFWITVWTDVINIIVKVITFIIELVTQWRDARDAIVEVATAIRDWVVAAFRQLVDWIQTAWSAFIDYIVARFIAFRDAVVALAQNILDWIVQRFTALRDGVVNIAQNIVDWVVQRFTALRDGVVGVAQNILDWVVQRITQLRDMVITLFGQAVDGVKAAWQIIQAAVATPINFIIHWVINDGLLKAWNTVMGWLGVDSLKVGLLDPIRMADGSAPGWAAGGLIPGPYRGPAADNMPGYVPYANGGVAPIRVNPREYIQPVAAVDNYGLPFMDAVRTGAFPAELAQAFAGGGQTYPRLTQWAFANLNNPIITSAYRPGANDYHGLGQAIDISNPGNTQAINQEFARKIMASFGNITELIHNPNASIKNGQQVPPSFWGAATWQQHLSHVHWAMTEAALGSAGLGGMSGGMFGGVADVLAFLQSSIHRIAELADNPITQTLKQIPGAILGHMWDLIKDQVGAFFARGTTPDGDNSAPGGLDAVKAAVQSVFATKGWGGGNEWAATDWIVGKESGWNPRAQNPSSTASGLFQMIDGTWIANRGNSNAAHMKDATITAQAYAGMQYIGQRYGDPLAAKSFWETHHYYDEGGWLPPGISTVFNGTGRPEPILTAAQGDGLARWMSSGGRGGDEGWGGLMRDVHIHHERGDSHEIMDDLWHRLKVAKRGGVWSTAAVSMAS